MALDLRSITHLTFDCYGTLIDWRGGALTAIAAMPSLEGCDHARLVDDWLSADRELTASDPYLPYGEVLTRGIVNAGHAQDRRIPLVEAVSFAAMQSAWPPFDESPATLSKLGERFSLAILSNVQTPVLEQSVAQLGVEFQQLVTAEQLQSYKPARAHFDEALKRLDVPKESVLHVACSLYHDVRPAQALGWKTAWINREDEPLPDDLEPDVVLPDLASLLRL